MTDPDTHASIPTDTAGETANDGSGDRTNAVGAFYTDDAVATFLARRGLWETLRTNLRSADREDDHCRIDPNVVRDIHTSDGSGKPAGATGFDVLSEHYEDDPAALNTIDETLADLTVCDPAVGDGSLLVAVAETLFEWRSRCVEHDPTALRREILSRNLFGVDVRPEAVEASRRRLGRWLCGDPGTDDPSVTLPDLTERIQTGNSLVGIVDDTALSECLSASDRPREAIEDRRDELRGRLDEQYASRQRRADDGPRMSDHVQSVAQVRRSLDVASEYSTVLRVTVPDGLPESIDRVLDACGFTTYTYTARLDDPTLVSSGSTDEQFGGGCEDRTVDERVLVSIFDRLRNDDTIEEWSVVVERDYVAEDFTERIDGLHWPLAFPTAMCANGGFDLVVGNPPYGVTLAPEVKALVTSECNYECQGATDTCEWFYERALDLAGEGGVVAFVVTKALAFYGTWADIRRKLLVETDTRHVFDVGLGFEDVNLETIALVSRLDKTPVENRQNGAGSDENTNARATESDVAVYRSKDRRDERANRPVRVGSVDERVMHDAGTVVFSPVSERQQEALDKILDCDRRLGDVMSTDGTTRQLYIPDSEKAALDAGADAYINKNHWVQPFHLENVWYCDLGAYREAVASYAVPRVMVKVLRGSRLRAWLDPNGELVGTEKLVNVPLADSHPTEIAFVYAALNHPCASFYLQTALFSDTTETARVMDGQYSRPIPVPTPSGTVESAVAILAWSLTLARQRAYDTDRELRTCDRVHRALDALVGGCYLDVGTDRVDAWSETLCMDGPSTERVRDLFESFYTARYAAPDGTPETYWSDIESVTRRVLSVVEDWETELVSDSPAMVAVEDAL